MKIFNSNIKMVKELTKYISPENITKARYNKYNAPKINDGNLLCDKFFRTGELFDKRTDKLKSFQSYSVDDLPVFNRSSLYAQDVQRLEGPITHFIERDLPYYVDIIGENKRIYLESYGVKGTKHPHEVDIDTSRMFLNRSAYKNHTVDEIANIRYYAKKISPFASSELEMEALSLLNSGFPLEGVINTMKEATIKTAQGEEKNVLGLMKFLAEFPHLKRYMITYSNDKSEVFDLFGARMFSDLVSMCNGDEKLAYKILWDCRVQKSDGSYLTDPNVLEAGMKLYRTDYTWNDKKSEIVYFLGQKNKEHMNKYTNKLALMIRINASLDDIKNEFEPKKRASIKKNW